MRAGVDTNLLVRFITADDPQHYARAKQVLQTELVFIPNTVWLETEWVLRHTYNYTKPAIVASMRAILGLPNVLVPSPILLAQALDWHLQGMDFADALHLAQCDGLLALYSFDTQFASRASQLKTPTAVVDP